MSRRKLAARILVFVLYAELCGNVYAASHGGLQGSIIKSPNFETEKIKTPLNKNAIARDELPGSIKSEAEFYSGGPTQPEMSSFKSVNADNMVNLFTGDFSYNIPLLDVGGYPVNLFYSGGIGMEQEATWAGLGWNINPGTVNRNMRGLPDDFDGNNKKDVITKTQSIKPDQTVGITVSESAKVFGLDANLSLQQGIFYNNYKGAGLELGGGLNIFLGTAKKSSDEKTAGGTDTTVAYTSAGVNVGGSFNLNSQEGMSLQPRISYELFKKNEGETPHSNLSLGIGTSYNSRSGITGLNITGESWAYTSKLNSVYPGLAEQYPLNVPITFAKPSYVPSIRMPITRLNISGDFKIGGALFGIHPNIGLKGYYTEARIDKTDMIQTKPAFGYMYMENAVGNKMALLDFNRINDNIYTPKTPLISFAQYTYDVFTINGEGTGGSFRAFRGNMGFVNDAYTTTKSTNIPFSAEAGVGQLVHVGAELDYINTTNTVYKWSSNNAAEKSLAFQSNYGDKSMVYFKNPGEKAIISKEYFDAIGGDQLARIKLINPGTNRPIASPALELFSPEKIKLGDQSVANAARTNRDKRTQVISYLNARDASRIGLDKEIRSYFENDFNIVACDRYRIIHRVSEDFLETYRQANHISEVTVLESDGKRYVYGIPVYNINQKDVTFAVDAGDPVNDGLVTYKDGENTSANQSGSDWYFQSEKIPAYAHSFLLTALLSPDYLDVTGDGITDDDPGDAVKFNYTRLQYSRATGFSNYNWRTPFDPSGGNKAILNEASKTESKDNKGSYSYGEREMWYLHSIESKNMVAFFTLSGRQDNLQPADENGGTAPQSSLRKVDRIDLYSKAEVITKGLTGTGKAKPIKSVFFSYSYDLCKGFPLNQNGGGKLTLESVWFTYNGNDNQKRNIYKFAYGNNINYKRNSQDRWGNYKSADQNPGGLSNADFPFVSSGNNIARTTTDQNASAWMLNKILLPSGSQINVDFESDDYAYVQNKRAAKMFQIAGFGNNPNDGYNPSNRLFGNAPFVGNYQTGDYDHIFVDVPDDIVATNISDAKIEVGKKYLESLKQLVFRIWVKLPKDYINASGYEPVTVYAEINDYGILPASNQFPANRKRIWISVKRIAHNASPIASAAVQMLRDNFPAKAFPGNNVNPDANAAVQIMRALVGMANNFRNSVRSIDRQARVANMCMTTDLSKSFIRLADPYYNKQGGGYRVKRITIKDGWNKLTAKKDANGNIVQQGESESTYGQEYDYSTEITVNGIKKQISSGVATYEPAIGAEENPFKEVLNFDESVPAGPTQQGFIDMPIGDAFFPSAMIGYSRVRVKSIHNKSNKNIKSGVGVQETKFFTSKDFPSFSDFTDFDPSSSVRYKPNPILKFLKIDQRQMVTLSQGLRVVLNDMNGKVKSQASYPENDLANPINYTEYFYSVKKTGENQYSLNNTVPVTGKDGSITNKEVGKEVEVMVDFREHKSETFSGGIKFNNEGFVIIIPIDIPILFKPPMWDENTFRSVSLLKVVNQYGVIDSVVQIDKGSMVSTKNLVYDSETGDVLVSRTQNEFNTPIYNTTYPAHWVYSGMEPAYKNIDVTYNNVVFRNGLLESSEVNQDFFESGDEIYVNDLATTGNIYSSAGCAYITGVSVLPRSNEFKIWALDIRKDDNNLNQPNKFIFIDKDGNPYNSPGATIRIVRSGKRNMLGASVSSITSLTNPVKSNKIEFNANDNVINASAVEYRDKWRAEQAFYVKSSYTDVLKQAPIDTISKAPNYWAVLQENRKGSNTESWYYEYGSYSNPASDDYVFARGWGGIRFDLGGRSWLSYDLGKLNNRSIIISARLNLIAHSYYKASFGTNVIIHTLPGRASPYHYNASPHESNANFPSNPNPFIISRMLTTWPGNNQASWGHLYKNSNYFDYQTSVLVPGTVPTLLGNNKSFTQNVINGQVVDESINVKDMVQQIVNDKIKGYDYGASFQLQLADRGKVGYEGRVCFNPTMSNIVIRYYDPAKTYGLPGNPSFPPPGTDVYSWTQKEWTSTCLSVFSRQFMNPYVHGIFGNWRNNKSYVFYGSRQQENPNAITTISSDGAIKDFVPYWVFNNGTLAPSGSSKWVWNSEITQVNKKGLEIENRDALLRYNAAEYGYNSNLPISVTNNSRFKESGFDGFEDYNYKDKICAGDCKPEREAWQRHLKWTNLNGNTIDQTTAHTGISSLKISPGSFVQTSLPVVTDDANFLPSVNINLLTTTQEVPPAGDGLTARYYDGNGRNSQGDPTGRFILTRVEPQIDVRAVNTNHGCDYGTLPAGFLTCTDFAVMWTGYIKAPEAGNYRFKFYDNDEAHFFILNGGQQQEIALTPDPNDGQIGYTGNIYLNKAEIIQIKVTLQQWGGWAFNHLTWKTPSSQSFVDIPTANLYSAVDKLTNNPPIILSCTRPEKIQVISNALIDQFSLIPGKKMVLSAWVKENNTVQGAGYLQNSIEISFNNNGTTTQAFAAAGQIIEGWQRYECVFVIPANATSLEIKLRNSAGVNVFFDDVRIHPYNSNMKSFVYHPANLRLMAELDENNYASFYEYDDDGTLTRVKKETRDGIKTIKETRSAIQRSIQTIE